GARHRGGAGSGRRDDRAGRRHAARPVTVQPTAERAGVARLVAGGGGSRRRLPPGSERGGSPMLTAALVAVALQQPAPAPAPAAPAAALPPQVGDTSPFRRLALPAPTLLREGSGRPGPRYWQQRADYTIRASLDTATHTITGSETIRYANNSPDTLTYLWLQLDQNIYRAASRGAAINPTDARFAGRGFEGGYTIQYVRAVQRFGKASGRAPLATTVNGTVMRAELDRPLPPGQAATLELAYSFEVPEHGSDRMGRCRADLHLALQRQERAGRGLGGRAQLHLGRERLRRRVDPVVVSSRGERRVGALH